MTDLLTILFGGGATGFIGSIFTQIFSFFKERSQHSRDMEVKRLEFDQTVHLHEMQLRAKAQEHQYSLEETALSSDYQALTASIEHDKSIKDVSRFWNNFRASVRPVVTYLGMLYLIVLGMYAMAYNDPIKNEIVSTGLYICVTAILWWFGDRAFNKVREKPSFKL